MTAEARQRYGQSSRLTAECRGEKTADAGTSAVKPATIGVIELGRAALESTIWKASCGAHPRLFAGDDCGGSVPPRRTGLASRAGDWRLAAAGTTHGRAHLRTTPVHETCASAFSVRKCNAACPTSRSDSGSGARTAFPTTILIPGDLGEGCAITHIFSVDIDNRLVGPETTADGCPSAVQRRNMSRDGEYQLSGAQEAVPCRPRAVVQAPLNIARKLLALPGPLNVVEPPIMIVWLS